MEIGFRRVEAFDAELAVRNVGIGVGHDVKNNVNNLKVRLISKIEELIEKLNNLFDN